MKSQNLMPNYLLGKVVLIGFLLIMVACSNNKSEAQQIKAPGMDIHTATMTGNLENVKRHIQVGTDLNQTEPMVASTPLIMAAVFGKTEVAKALIDAGVDIDYQNKEGSTALHAAAFFCRTEIVKLLLEKKADKSLKNQYGSTPLESVQGAFKDVKGAYEMFNASLGLKLDYEHIEATRPKIATLLK